MPPYPWLFSSAKRTSEYKTKYIQDKMNTLVKLGVPYSEEEIANAELDMEVQSTIIAEALNEHPDIEVNPREEIVALIAYLQRLGTDIKVKPEMAQR
jgi:cytochrome c oxidase cbb3-type subunit I/II